MGSEIRMRKIMLSIVVMASMAMASMGTLQDDEQECAEEMGSLAACIPYVSGTAKKPTPQCCQDTQKLKATKPKCLCLLIKESTDPSMGLPINTTLALQMPTACNIDAKISHCPSLLNISPDSPDGKIFKEAGADSTTTTTSTTDSPPSTSASTSSGSSSSSSSTSPDSGSKSNSKADSSGSDGSMTTKVYAAGIIMAFAALIFI